MPEFSAPEPAQTLFDTLETASSVSSEFLIRVFMVTQRRLLEGRPVPLDELAEATALPRSEFDQLLDRLEAEREDRGGVVGLGLTLRPTPHQYETDGKIFYGWCAADTLIYPPVFQQTARVTSRDPLSGAAVTLTATPDAVERQEPPSAVITWVEDGMPFSLRESFCLPSRFFASAPAAHLWVTDRENEGVRSVAEAYRDARAIADRIYEWRTDV